MAQTNATWLSSISRSELAKYSWRPATIRLNDAVLFENGEREFIFIAAKCSGNPVRIRNGCATVTGYKLPAATESFTLSECREGGSEVKARSQDTGLVALVVAVQL